MSLFANVSYCSCLFNSPLEKKGSHRVVINVRHEIQNFHTERVKMSTEIQKIKQRLQTSHSPPQICMLSMFQMEKM